MSCATNLWVIEELNDRIARLEGSAAKKLLCSPLALTRWMIVCRRRLAYGALYEIADGGAGTVS